MPDHDSHLLVEADSTDGVLAVPIDTRQDYNVRVCRPLGTASGDLQEIISGVFRNSKKKNTKTHFEGCTGCQWISTGRLGFKSHCSVQDEKNPDYWVVFQGPSK